MKKRFSKDHTLAVADQGKYYRESDFDLAFGPRYNVGSSALEAFRRKAAAEPLTAEQKAAYGAAVLAAVRRANTPARREATFKAACASGSFANDAAGVLAAVRASNHARFAAAVRRDRDEYAKRMNANDGRGWRQAYEAAMEATRTRRAERAPATAPELVELAA
jgi:hypothetical protein